MNNPRPNFSVAPRLVYPDREVIEKSRASAVTYVNPLTRIVFWNRYGTGFDMVTKLMRETGKERFARVVEIGISYGFFLPSLCQIAEEVIGTDIRGTFDWCKGITLNSIRESCPNLVLKVADAINLSEDIEPGSCDLIVAFSVLEHIDRRQEAVQEIRRCLSSDGWFLCELPSENVAYKFGRHLIGYPDAHPNYDYPSVKAIIEKGFFRRELRNSPFGFPLFKIGLYGKRS